MSVVKKQMVTKAWLNSAANANMLNPGDFYVIERDGTYQATSTGVFVEIKDVQLPVLGSAAYATVINEQMSGPSTVMAQARQSLTNENLNELTYQDAPGAYFQTMIARGTFERNYPANSSAGAVLALGGPYDGTHFFVPYGANAKLAWRYSLASNSWSSWRTVAAQELANIFIPAQTFNGGAKIGESGPVIKQQLITGSMPSVGTAISVPIGLAPLASAFIQINVVNAEGSLIPPNNPASTLNYSYYLTPSRQLSITTGAAANDVAGRPFEALVTYIV